LHLVPRVCEMLYHRYLGELHGRGSNGAAPGAVEAEVKADMRRAY